MLRCCQFQAYTSTRSIGAGELWEYPVDFAGQTVQPGQKLVGRISLTAQVGPEEPFCSGDAAFLYFSRNVMDSTVWNYNKDPHQQIYSIFRLNLATRAIEFVTGGAGGAGRPIVSHKSDRY